MSSDRFPQRVVDVVARRAANICSNPDCLTITSGPSKSLEKSINLGEAAHIYGAKPGSARYDEGMTSTERSDVANAIWLCRNCHKLVDNDPSHFPAGLLFEWIKEHEVRVAEKVGKTGAEARRRYIERQLGSLGNLSYRAEQIIIQKPEYWEYLLTAEVLKSKLHPILDRWDDLKENRYFRSRPPITTLRECCIWYDQRIYEVHSLLGPFSQIVDHSFERAWGKPGVAGSEGEIVRVCGLLAELSEELLRWEESVRFPWLPSPFKRVRELLSGIAGRQLDQIQRVPAYFAEVFSDTPEPGRYELILKLSLPDGWTKEIDQELDRAIATMSQDGSY